MVIAVVKECALLVLVLCTTIHFIVHYYISQRAHMTENDEQHFKRNPAETDQGIEELSNLLWRVHF